MIRKTYDGAEIDLVEERDGKLFGYAFKWKKKGKAPASWLEMLNTEYEAIYRENFLKFLAEQ